MEFPFIHKLIKSKPIWCLEHSEVNGGLQLQAVEAQFLEAEFDCTQKQQCTIISDLSQWITKEQQVHLVINDQQVLQKTVPLSGSDGELLAKAYPNLDSTNFYYQILHTSNFAFVSICRKQYVEALLEEYIKNEINITQFSLGAIQAAYVVEYVGQSSFLTTNHFIETNTNEIAQISLATDLMTEEYDIEGEFFKNTEILSLSLLLKQAGVAVKITDNTFDKNKTLKKSFTEKRFFKQALMYGLGGLLLLLVCNFFVFNSRFEKFQRLQQEVQLYENQKTQLDERLKVVESKKEIIESVYRSGFSKSSWYVDQIIQQLPTSIVLEQLQYQPLKKTIRKSKPIQLNKQMIVVKGKSNNKDAFSDWLSNLEQLEMVNEVTILNYAAQKKKQLADFEVNIELVVNEAAN